MSENNGGPAFPSHPSLYPSDWQDLAKGMGLRDWFAGQALAGAWKTNLSDSEVADQVYGIADAMLKAREAK